MPPTKIAGPTCRLISPNSTAPGPSAGHHSPAVSPSTSTSPCRFPRSNTLPGRAPSSKPCDRARASAVRMDNSLQDTRRRIPVEQEKHMTDQQSQGDFAAGERAEPQGPARDFAEGEERHRPGPPRDFAEGEERHAPGASRDFAQGEEQHAPPRPALANRKDKESS